MLEDRDYMRQPAYHKSRVSFTVALLIVLAAAFLVECAALGYPPRFQEHDYFALNLWGMEHGFVWQLLTYQFMHAGLVHIFLNGWAIYVFGREIETVLGPRKFLTLFLSAGVIGGMVQELVALGWPDDFGGPVVGASAGALGLVAAYALLFPERELTLLLFFVLPLRLSAKMLLIGSAALAVFGLVFPFDNIANAAHLGGMLTGIVFVRQFVQGRWPRWKFPARSAAPRKLVASRAGERSFWRSAAGKPDEDLPAGDFLSSEVDPILDKISAHGIHSLTARERDILEKARKKMTGR
jgi:membrane associated rhomboid family serine protease